VYGRVDLVLEENDVHTQPGVPIINPASADWQRERDDLAARIKRLEYKGCILRTGLVVLMTLFSPGVSDWFYSKLFAKS
jgi:hypothetical protein